MKEIIIIGTIHAGFTPKNELKEIIQKYNPNQILVEIAEEDIKNKKLKSYPPEMIFTYNWAKQNQIKVNGFDSKINVMKKGVTKKEKQRIMEEGKRLMKSFTWKDMNKPRNLKKINIKSIEKFVDSKKEKERQVKMLRNIRKLIVNEGRVIIITGCGHLDFFKKNIKGAFFPLR